MDQLTLRTLRDQSNLSLREITERMKQADPTVPQFRTGVIHLEKRGTESIKIIKALAFAYQLPLDAVEQAAANSRKQWEQGPEKKLPKRSLSA